MAAPKPKARTARRQDGSERWGKWKLQVFKGEGEGERPGEGPPQPPAAGSGGPGPGSAREARRGACSAARVPHSLRVRRAMAAMDLQTSQDALSLRCYAERGRELQTCSDLQHSRAQQSSRGLGRFGGSGSPFLKFPALRSLYAGLERAQGGASPLCPRFWCRSFRPSMRSWPARTRRHSLTRKGRGGSRLRRRQLGKGG